MAFDLFGADTADAGDGRTAVLVVVGTLVGGAGSWLFSRWYELYKERRDRADKRDQSLADRERELRQLETCRADEAEGELADKTEQLSRCRIAAAQRLQQIRFYERVMAANGLSFEKYTEGPGEDFGSHIHKQLKPDSPDKPPSGHTEGEQP